jgi:hypothetical protein
MRTNQRSRLVDTFSRGSQFLTSIAIQVPNNNANIATITGENNHILSSEDKLMVYLLSMRLQISI